MADIAVAVRVSGRVQGVWFRGWTQERAMALGLRGWVRNRADGDVEGLISGPEPQVRQMIDALHRGPRNARVVCVEWTETDLFHGAGFEVRR